MHGSVRHLSGKDFTLTIQWQVFAVFSLNTRASNPGPAIPRSIGRDGPVLQRCSHILYRLFLPVLCGHFQGAAHQFQLFCADFPQITSSPPHSGQQLSSGSRRYISGGDVPVTDDDGATVATGGEPRVILTPTVTIAFLLALFQQASACSTSRRSFSERVPNSIRAVFLSEPADALFLAHLLRSFFGTCQCRAQEGLRLFNQTQCWSF